MTLHGFVLFIGDKPSKENVHVDVPFVGTRSYKKLLEWCYEMDVDVTRIGLANACSIKATDLRTADRIVVLGAEAEKKVKRYSGLEYFALPHPSGKNRVLNNQREIKKILDEGREYVYGRSKGRIS